MRVGTWNLAGRWTEAHHQLIVAQDCDVWLFTEVSDRVGALGRHRHVTARSMPGRRRWAGVSSRASAQPLPDPHPASAAVVITG